MPRELDKLHSAIKAQLKKDHPDWDEDKLEQSAWAIANSEFKKTKKEEVKRTEDGRIIVGENVKLYIGGNITSVGEVIEG